MRTWIKCVALLSMIVPLLFGACGGVPSEPLLRFAGQNQCNPNMVFKTKGIPLKTAGQFEGNIFVKSERVGCIGVFWEGQTGDPPTFTSIIKEDGSYIVYDPNTKQPATESKIGATVAPGVGQVDVVVCVTNASTDKVLEVDCKNFVRNKASGCLNNPAALYAWQGTQIPMDPNQGNGTCSLCHHETCDGKDNNCDGQVDEGGACGRIVGASCSSYDKAAIDAGAPKCDSKELCKCMRLSNGEYYVCYGKTTGAVQWTKVSAAMPSCTEAVSKSLDPSVNRAFCGKTTLVCDQCDGSYVWRSTEGPTRCSDVLRNPQ